MTPNSVLPPTSYETIAQTLLVVIFLAFFVERVLALVFEHDWWQELEKKNPRLGALKEFIAVGTAFGICNWASFDALAQIFQTQFFSVHPVSNLFSRLMTALVIAGGSKGAIALMQGYFGIKSTPSDSGKPIANPPAGQAQR